ncbi:hypothetical protein FB446DRAFT_796034 [Lentinula raphanica]|nr:hypothetical protein FB446DRAFT_796034 [Lentinula raphanica]
MPWLSLCAFRGSRMLTSNVARQLATYGSLCYIRWTSGFNVSPKCCSHLFHLVGFLAFCGIGLLLPVLYVKFTYSLSRPYSSQANSSRPSTNAHFLLLGVVGVGFLFDRLV